VFNTNTTTALLRERDGASVIEKEEIKRPG